MNKSENLPKISEDELFKIRISRRKEVILTVNKRENLKMKSISLSEQIFQFLHERDSASPPKPALETWLEDLKRITEFHHETMDQYTAKFASMVTEIRDQFADISLRDDELDSIYKNPTNPIGIRRVAERIGALAEKLEKK